MNESPEQRRRRLGHMEPEVKRSVLLFTLAHLTILFTPFIVGIAAVVLIGLSAK